MPPYQHLCITAPKGSPLLIQRSQTASPMTMVRDFYFSASRPDNVVEDTHFPHKDLHKWTWYSPDGSMKKMIDHILISKCWTSTVTNCRVYRGAELGNADHRLLAATFKHKLKATSPKKKSRVIAWHYWQAERVAGYQSVYLYNCQLLQCALRRWDG